MSQLMSHIVCISPICLILPSEISNLFLGSQSLKTKKIEISYIYLFSLYFGIACAHAHTRTRVHAPAYTHPRARTRAHSHACTHACAHMYTLFIYVFTVLPFREFTFHVTFVYREIYYYSLKNVCDLFKIYTSAKRNIAEVLQQLYSCAIIIFNKIFRKNMNSICEQDLLKKLPGRKENNKISPRKLELIFIETQLYPFY